MEALAKLPSLNDLRGKLVGLIQAPATKVLRVIIEPSYSSFKDNFTKIKTIKINYIFRRIKVADIEKIAESLSSLTVLEAADLAKLLEEKWGVSASAPVAALQLLEEVMLRQRLKLKQNLMLC